MTEEQMLVIVGRLYVGLIARDNEISRLRALIEQSQNPAPPVALHVVGDEDDADVES